MSTACHFPSGVIHDRGNAECHEASRQAGAVEALRSAAVEVHPIPECSCEVCETRGKCAATLNAIADKIERSAP